MNIIDPNSLDCSICLAQYKNPHMTSCGHSFCYECVAPYLNKSCPLCRKQVTTLTQNFQLLSVVDSISTAANTASRVMTSASPALGISNASYSSSSTAPVVVPPVPIESPKPAVCSPTSSAVSSYSSVPLYGSQLPNWGTSHPPMLTTASTPSYSSSSCSTVCSSPSTLRQWPDEITQCLAMKASTIADARSKLLALLMTLPSSNIELQQKLLLIGLHIDDATCQTLITNLDMPVGIKERIESSLDLVLAMYNRLGFDKVCEQIQILLSTMSSVESKKEIPHFIFRDMACRSRTAIIRHINDKFGVKKLNQGLSVDSLCRIHLIHIFHSLMNHQLCYCLAMYCFTPGCHLEKAKKHGSDLFSLVEGVGKIHFDKNFDDFIATLMQMPLED